MFYSISEEQLVGLSKSSFQLQNIHYLPRHVSLEVLSINDLPVFRETNWPLQSVDSFMQVLCQLHKWLLSFSSKGANVMLQVMTKDCLELQHFQLLIDSELLNR